MGGLALQFPLSLGGADETHEQEQRALLEALEPAFDTSYGTELWAETYADATAVAIAWACNRRQANSGNPLRMLETLRTHEEACGLRPTIDQTDSERRANLAGKYRSGARNAFLDITETCRAILGTNFSEIRWCDPTDEITYWPGINPGPPGYEWTSNRLRVCVVTTEDGLSPRLYAAKRDATVAELNRMLPSWQNYTIGVGSGFVVGVGIVGKTIL